MAVKYADFGDCFKVAGQYSNALGDCNCKLDWWSDFLLDR